MDKFNTASTYTRMIKRFLGCSFRPTYSTYVFLGGVHLVWGGGGDAAARLPRPGPEPSGGAGKEGGGRGEEGEGAGLGQVRVLRCERGSERKERGGEGEGEWLSRGQRFGPNSAVCGSPVCSAVAEGSVQSWNIIT